MRRGTAACLVFFLTFMTVLHASVSTAEKPLVTGEYFENLDKESSLQDIVEDAGNYSIEGSGILYFVWPLDDGSRAKTVFDSKGRIAMIYIVGENGGERIYKREYRPAGSGAGHASASEIIDPDEAVIEMRQAIGEKLPASARMFYPDPVRVQPLLTVNPAVFLQAVHEQGTGRLAKGRGETVIIHAGTCSSASARR